VEKLGRIASGAVFAKLLIVLREIVVDFFIKALYRTLILKSWGRRRYSAVVPGWSFHNFPKEKSHEKLDCQNEC